jgi:hypothetical protein
MSAIQVYDDTDFKRTIEAVEMADRVGRILAAAYPGYRWHVEPHPHPVRPFVDFEPEIGLMPTRLGHVGGTVVLSDFYSSSSLEKKIRDLAGQMLEMGACNRRAFNETEFVGRAKNAYGLIVPQGAV